jgi:hypothetical protein
VRFKGYRGDGAVLLAFDLNEVEMPCCVLGTESVSGTIFFPVVSGHSATSSEIPTGSVQARAASRIPWHLI